MDLIEHFHEHGWARVPQAFCPEAAAAMRDAVWHVLADDGIHRDEPSTWTLERPTHLQRLKEHSAFRAVGSPSMLAVLDAILAGRVYEAPKNWGALFIAFPGEDKWGIPTSGWHIDAKYTSALTPTGGVKTFALFGDVAPRCGGTQILSGFLLTIAFQPTFTKLDAFQKTVYLCLVVAAAVTTALALAPVHLHRSLFLPPRTTDSRGSFLLSVPKNSKERRKRKNLRMVNTPILSTEFGTARIVVAQKISPLVVAKARLATSPSVALVVCISG